MIVEMAAIVGSMKSLRALNMCLVNVALTPPEMKIEMMTSSNDVKNANNAEVMTEKRIWGRVIIMNAFSLEAPKLLATRSWFIS